MKYFIDDADIIYAYEDDGSQDKFIGNKKEITEDEVNSILNHPPSQAELIENAEIAWRQDAVDAGISTDEETAALSEWKKYRVLLMRVDTAKPVWPTLPGEQAS